MSIAEDITEPNYPAHTDRLIDHYKVIGSALREYESFSYVFNADAKLRSFRHAVSIVPVETLESYLDDLLEQDLSDEVLFIAQRGIFSRVESWFLCGATASLLTIGALSLFSLSNILSFGIAGTLFALLFVVTSLLVHTRSIIRRMGFAKVVSLEISRRRGGGAAKEAWTSNPFRNLFSSQGIPGSAARMLH